MKTESILLANWLMCPDGTMLPSFHRHDYRKHITVDNWKNKVADSDDLVRGDVRYSMVDGGTDYIRRGGTYTEMSVYSDDSFEVIRRFLCRGGRGATGREPLTWTPLFRMNDDWLENTIQYEANFRPNSKFIAYYRLEQIYRRENNIKIS